MRERLIGARTALINEVHGLMHEYGIVIPKGVSKFRQAVVDKLESDQDKLTALSQEMFWKLVEEFVDPRGTASLITRRSSKPWATTHPECQRLMTIPGIGPDHGDGAGRGGRRCWDVQEWPPVCRLVRVGARDSTPRVDRHAC